MNQLKALLDFDIMTTKNTDNVSSYQKLWKKLCSPRTTTIQTKKGAQVKWNIKWNNYTQITV